MSSKSIFDEDPRNKILAQVKEGMDVYDADGDRLGKVEFVRFGDMDSADPVDTDRLDREDSLIGNLAEALSTDEEMPDTVAERFLRHGYIRIDSGGLFSDDKYVGPELIAGVDTDGVRLRVTKEELTGEDED